MAEILSKTVTTRDEVIALAGLAGLIGLGVILIGVKGGGGPTQSLPVGAKSLGPPILSNGYVTDASGNKTPVTFAVPSAGCPPTLGGGAGSITLPLTGTLTINDPMACYEGSPNNFYTYAQLKQTINGKLQSVFGSGVAGDALGADNLALTAPRQYPLVSSTEIQPSGPPGPLLTLYNWLAAQSTVGLCGAAPIVGPARLYVQIYGNATETGNPADADGFSSPTCNNRRFYVEYVWPGTIQLV